MPADAGIVGLFGQSAEIDLINRAREAQGMKDSASRWIL
jgi:hypothetical protein